jgi:hypothetical protein
MLRRTTASLLAAPASSLMSVLHLATGGHRGAACAMSDTSATRDAYGATVWTIGGYGDRACRGARC